MCLMKRKLMWLTQLIDLVCWWKDANMLWSRSDRFVKASHPMQTLYEI